MWFGAGFLDQTEMVVHAEGRRAHRCTTRDGRWFRREANVGKMGDACSPGIARDGVEIE